MSSSLRLTHLVCLSVLALAAAACGDDTSSTSAGGGGGGTTSGTTSGATTSSTSGGVTTATVTSSSTQSGGGEGQGGDGTGGEGIGGDGTGGDGTGGHGTGGDGTGGAGGTGGAEQVATELVVASNPTGRDGDAVRRLPLELAAPMASYPTLADITSIQNVDIADDGDGWITYDRLAAFGTAAGGLMRVTDLETAATANLGGGDRRVEGANTLLLSPRGVRVVEELGVVLVADTTSGILAFATASNGDDAPLFVASGGSATSGVWDIEYDVVNDRLYGARTDGVVVVYDAFFADEGVDGPTRTITPTDGANKISVNLHGIELIPAGIVDPEILVLSDVGLASDATDGQLFAIANPSTASGDTAVRARYAGANTFLGNPVDLDVVGTDVYVAEKSNDRILRFAAIATATNGTQNTAPLSQVTVTKAESIVVLGSAVTPELVAVTNPANRDADAVLRIDGTAGTTTATLGNIGILQSIQSAIVGDDGSVYATVDLAGTTGAVLVVDGLADAVADTAIGTGTRRIAGVATGLVGPKGLQLVDLGGTDYLLVADSGAPRDIKVFLADASGDVAPVALFENLGADRAPWDIEYDPAGDRLYVACTDGTLVVFDDFSDLTEGAPAREITPALASADVSSNLHGVTYLAEEDLLVLSDVGDASNATDGRIYTIAGASVASGLVNVRLRISGASLGNPVATDVANGNLYVAEKSNDLVLRWNGIAALTGDITTAANQSTAVTKPESVFVRHE